MAKLFVDHVPGVVQRPGFDVALVADNVALVNIISNNIKDVCLFAICHLCTVF